MVMAPIFALLAFLSTASALAPNPGGYHPPNTPASAWTQNAVLCYMDARSYPSSPSHSAAFDWTVADFKKLVAFESKANETLDYFFDTFLFLGYVWFDGKSFWPGAGKPMNASDWRQFLQLQMNMGVAQLNAAAEEVHATLGVGVGGACARHTWPRVILAMPIPDPNQHDFGAITPGGRSLNFSIPADRLAAAKWAIDEAVDGASKSEGVVTVGFYWFLETITARDAALVADVAAYVHAKGLKFFWIPYYEAPGGYSYAYWHDALGFDTVWLQPNYAFHNSTLDRFAAVNATASTNYMGVEMELPMGVRNPQLHGDWNKSLHQYLAAGVEYGFMDRAVKAYYYGNSFVEMQRNATLWSGYRDIYSFAKGTYPNLNLPQLAAAREGRSMHGDF